MSSVALFKHGACDVTVVKPDNVCVFAVLILITLCFNKVVVVDKPDETPPAFPESDVASTASPSFHSQHQPTEPPTSDSLQACLLDVCNMLPLTLAEGGFQLTRNSVIINQQDDAESMLTRASAELHCIYAQELFDQGRNKAAFKIMTKVCSSASVHLPMWADCVTSHILSRKLRARGT